MPKRLEPYMMHQRQRPIVGDAIIYQSRNGTIVRGTITSVEKGICWYRIEGCEEPTCFIWAFREGCNNLHDWPTK